MEARRHELNSVMSVMHVNIFVSVGEGLHLLHGLCDLSDLSGYINFVCSV
jgi:hypothetical protein